MARGPGITKAKLLATVIVAIAAAVISASHIHITQTPTRTQTRYVAMPSAKAPDGYMSGDQCRALRHNISYNDLQQQYGWPHGTSPADDQYQLAYPLRENHDYTCTVSYLQDSNKPSSINIDLYVRSY